MTDISEFPASPQRLLEGAALWQASLMEATAFPETHDQNHWFYINAQRDKDGNVSLCGTAGCAAGHAAVLGTGGVLVVNIDSLALDSTYYVDDIRVPFSDGRSEDRKVEEVAAELLGLTVEEADYAFSEERTRDELWEFGEHRWPGVVSRPSPEELAAYVAAGRRLKFTGFAVDYLDSIVPLAELPL